MGPIKKIQEVIRNPKNAIATSRYKILSVVGHKGYRRFIVLSRSRTGSNMLISYLNSHPNIYSEGEIFGRLNGRDYRKILASVFSKQPRNIKAKGFKLFYYHPVDEKDSLLWNTLAEMKDVYVIHLKRRNILRTLISRKLAEKNDIWMTTTASPEQSQNIKQVHFDPDELKKDFEETRQWEQTADDMFKGHNMETVFYEDLVKDLETNFRKITDFLGVEYHKPQTRLRRQNPEKISDLISNYPEVSDAFKGTAWLELFDEENTA